MKLEAVLGEKGKTFIIVPLTVCYFVEERGNLLQRLCRCRCSNVGDVDMQLAGAGAGL